MNPLVIGLLHPGTMGAAFGREARLAGAAVLWCRDGRSSATVERATNAGLDATDQLEQLTGRCGALLAICPPAASESVADAVAATGYEGLYVDANAVSPERSCAIGATMRSHGARYVDAAIIGAPPTPESSARLYLSGDRDECAVVASVFAGSAVETAFLSGDVGAASALKMAFSSYRKSVRVLAAISHALARRHGVADALIAEGHRMNRPVLAEADYLPTVAARAWRWAPELDDCASTLRAAELPEIVASATADVLRQWEGFKDMPNAALADLLDALSDEGGVSTKPTTPSRG